ncbi:hypothetical protein VNO77_46290 [Canavalia gladiata]|uniref:DNA-directed RNA polymerase n=1 Tax=Canavalia gladiata TaxID=3824 RepID=A0AAN9PJ38_CANGL
MLSSKSRNASTFDLKPFDFDRPKKEDRGLISLSSRLWNYRKATPLSGSFQALLTQQGECFPASRSTLDYFPYPRANANGDSPGPKIQRYAPGNGSKDATGESFYGSGKGYRDALRRKKVGTFRKSQEKSLPFHSYNELLSEFGHYTLEALILYILGKVFQPLQSTKIRVAYLVDALEEQVRTEAQLLRAQRLKLKQPCSEQLSISKLETKFPFGSGLVEFMVNRNLIYIESDSSKRVDNKKGQYYLQSNLFVFCNFDVSLLPVKLNLPMVYPPIEWKSSLPNGKHPRCISDLTGGYLSTPSGQLYNRYSLMIIKLANAYNGYKFDLPAYLDFRGRIYRSGFLHFHERDLAKSLVIRANTKPLVGNDRENLKQNISSAVFHYQAFNKPRDAIKWYIEIFEDLEQFQTNQKIANLIRFSQDAKRGFQFLSHMVSLVIHDKNDNSIPIIQDASASAYQIISNLLLDETLAMKTNLIPS